MLFLYTLEYVLVTRHDIWNNKCNIIKFVLLQIF